MSLVRGAARLGLRWAARKDDEAVRGLAQRLFGPSWRRFEAATRDPVAVQTARLNAILEQGRDTAFGQEHGFDRIRGWDDFRARVPVRDFEASSPWLDRVVAGEGDVLFPGRPHFFGRTSGTTGKPKLIPVNAAFTEEMRRPRRVWARQLALAFPGLVRGQIFGMHSPTVEGRTEAGVPYGSVTVGLTTPPGRPERALEDGVLDAVPRAVFAVSDFELKYRLAARMAAQAPVALLSAINPSTVALLMKTLEAHAELIADELEAGTFSDMTDLPEGVAKIVKPRLRAAPERAAALRAGISARGRLEAKDLWPELVGVSCWKGGSAPFFLGQLERWLPGVPVMDQGMFATEGGFAFPLSPDASGGVVAVLGHALEFVPEAEAEAGDFSGARLADTLEVGARYRLLVTGSHGLYRYDMNDVVECTGHHHATAEIAFVHKGGHMLSLTGEKVSEAQVVAAATAAAARLGLSWSGFMATVSMDDPPRYAWWVEPDRPDPVAEEALSRALEDELRAQNVEYAAKRDSLRLGPPTVVRLRPGAFAAERAERVAAGAPDAHLKPPHLGRDPELIRRLERYRA